MDSIIRPADEHFSADAAVADAVVVVVVGVQVEPMKILINCIKVPVLYVSIA